MADIDKAYQATPAATLAEQIMDPCIAKNEREWWAHHEIERLRAALRDTVAYIVGDISGPAQRDGIVKEARAALQETKIDCGLEEAVRQIRAALQETK